MLLHFVAAHFYDNYEYGGTQEQFGIKDPNLLLSALNEMRQTFDGQDLYPSIYDKAACLVRSIIQNHPFHNANKRTAVLAMIVFLDLNHYRVKVSQKKLVDFACDIAVHKPPVSRIARSIRKWVSYTPLQRGVWKQVLSEFRNTDA